MDERHSPSRAVGTKLSCGCSLAFMPGVDVERLIPLEKSPEILNAYDTLFLKCHADFSPKRILEIGVKHGGSLLLWGHVFGQEAPPAILGIDKDLRLTELAKIHLLAHASKTNAITAEAPFGLGRFQGPFDLVIDDGSHVFDDIIGSFGALWPKISEGGLYVIEDWRTDASRPYKLMETLLNQLVGYWPDPHGPGNGAPVQIHWFRDLVAIQKGPMAK